MATGRCRSDSATRGMFAGGGAASSGRDALNELELTPLARLWQADLLGLPPHLGGHPLHALDALPQVHDQEPVVGLRHEVLEAAILTRKLGRDGIELLLLDPE